MTCLCPSAAGLANPPTVRILHCMDEDDRTLFEAVITPHRSLTGRQAIAVALVLSGLSIALGGALAWLGAWPVLGFSGAEIALAAMLLVRHARAGCEAERVRLTDRTIHVVRDDGRGRVRRRALSTAWLAVALEERPGTVPRLVLRRRGVTIEIARVLGEDEKRALGEALAAALADLRSPRFDYVQLRDA